MLDLRDRGTTVDGARLSPVVLVGAALLAGAIVAGVVGWILVQPASLGYDTLILQAAADRLIAGLPLYLDPEAARFVPGSVELYYGPPAFAVASVPLTYLDERGIRVIAMPVSLSLVLAALAALVRTVPGRITRLGVLALLVGTLLSFAVLWGSTLGAASILVLFLLSMAWLALERGVGRIGALIGAVCIGTAIAFRLYPAALLIPLVLGRRRGVAGASLVVAAAWTFLGIIVAGFDQTREYLDVARALALLGSPSWGVAPAALATAAGWPTAAVASVRAGAFVLGAALLAAGGLLIGDRTLGRQSPRVRLPERAGEGAPGRLVGWGLALAGMLLVTPVVWDHYLTALLPLTVGLVALSRRAILGLLPIVLLPGLLGGIALVALPVAALIAIRRRLQPARGA